MLEEVFVLEVVLQKRLAESEDLREDVLGLCHHGGCSRSEERLFTGEHLLEWVLALTLLFSREGLLVPLPLNQL